MAPIRKLQTTDYISKAKVEEITLAAFDLLETVGIAVPNPDMADALKKAGVSFSAKGRAVIPKGESHSFLEVLRQNNGLLIKETEAKLSAQKLRGVQCSYALRRLDPFTEEVSPFDTDALIQDTQFCAKVAEAFSSRFAPFAPGTPADVDPALDSLLKYKISAQHAPGTIPIEPTSLLSAQYMFEMAQVMNQPIKRLPVYTITPLCLAGESAEMVWRFKDKLEDFYVFAMPALGSTAPLSVSGSLALCLAEVLGAGLLMHKLTGLPCYLKPNINPFDLQAMQYAFGTPQKFVYERLAEDFTAQLLGTPPNIHSINIHTAAGASDAQSALEKVSIMTAGAFTGATLFYCIGTLSVDEVFSPVELILDCLRLKQVEGLLEAPVLEFLEGFAEEAAQCLDSGFLLSENTLDNYRAYLDYSPYFNRGNKKSPSGQDFMLEEAKKEARRLYEAPPVYALAPEKFKELEAIYASAQNRI